MNTIQPHELEGAYFGALLSQIERPVATVHLQDVDSTAFSGHVVRFGLNLLQDLVVERGLGLSRPEACGRLKRALSDSEDAVAWIDSIDLDAGLRANLDKLGRQVEHLHAARDADAILASSAVKPETLDDDIAGIMARLAEILSRASDDRYQVDTLEPYLIEYAQGIPVIPSEQADSNVCWGVEDLDDPENGIIASRGTLGVIAAPPGFGKSIAVSQLAVQSALRMGKHVFLVSLEQLRRQVAMRAIASLRGDYKTSVKKGHTTNRLVPEVEFDAAKKVHIMSPGSGTAWFRVEAAARRLHRQGKLDVLILDYFTLLEPPAIGKQFSSASMYGWISKAAKRLAQELLISVVLVAQFNRQQGAWDQEPEMRDLKETGQLEQDADWLWFMWAPPKKDGLQPVLDTENRVVCYKKAKNRWGKMDFSGSPRYLEVDPARDRIHPYVRTTDGAVPGGDTDDKF